MQNLIMVASGFSKKGNLPHYLTHFIGRRREVEELRSLLSKQPLLTLTGAGGSGKTRLALQAASDLEQAFPDGIWFVELAELTDPELVPQAVLSALGVRTAPAQTARDALIRFLDSRRALLLLDNCEHLLDACAETAAALLQNCPHLHLLATSREALGLPGEMVRPMLPLALPASYDFPDLAELSEVESIALFLDRARLLVPEFHLTGHNASSVIQICRLLDGIPLAIELAAARVPVLEVTQIAARLQDNLQLLVDGVRLRLPRHQTMRAAIDWSYTLLSVAEQTLWRRLAIFRGNFSLPAVEAVCAHHDGLAWTEHDILDLLAHLIRKSMVMTTLGQGEMYFWLLEPLRQYAAEKLEEAGEAERIRQTHCAYYLTWAEQHAVKLRGAEQLEWLEQFDIRYSNLRAGLVWSLQGAELPERSLRFAVALGPYWFLRNLLGEGRRWLEESLAQPVADWRIPGRIQALCLAGILTYFQGDYPAARRYTEEAHTLARSLGFTGQWGLGYSLMMLGQIVRFFGEREAAFRYSHESVSLFRAIDDRWGLAVALASLGEVSVGAGDLETARRAFEESQSLWHAIGDPWGLALNMHLFAFLACKQGDATAARTLFAGSNPTFEALGDFWHVAHSHRHLGDLARHQGDHSSAVAHYRLCLPLFQKLGIISGTAAVLSGLAAAASALGSASEAASCFYEALTHLQRLPAPSGAAVSIQALADAAGNLGRMEMAARLLRLAEANNTNSTAAVGSSVSPTRLLSELILEAQQLLLDVRVSEAAAPLSGLTPREAEVLRLLMVGLTNPQIADRLVVSRRTVNAHLRSIYKKLGVNTRTAAARIALEQNIR